MQYAFTFLSTIVAEAILWTYIIINGWHFTFIILEFPMFVACCRSYFKCIQQILVCNSSQCVCSVYRIHPFIIHLYVLDIYIYIPIIRYMLDVSIAQMSHAEKK